MSKELIERLRGNPFAVRGADYLEAADTIESLTAERDRLREAIESVLKGALMADGVNRDGTGLSFAISMGDFDPSTKKWLLSIEKKLQEALS